MSSSQVIDWVGNGKIYNDLLPNPYPFPAQPSGLAAVLAVNPNGDDAGNQNISNLLQIEVTNVVQQDQIGGHLTIGGTPANPGSGGTLRIQGGTDKGSILVGDGTDTKQLVCPTTTTTSTTSTIYNWLSLANGQSKSFLVSNGSLYQLGYSITIVYSGTDSITGTITAVVGNLVTITIVSFTSAVYTPAPLITTTPPDPATATSGGGDPVFIFNPAVCTPTTIPANSFLLTGLCYLYSAPAAPASNITLTAIAIGAVNPTTSVFTIPVYENPPVSTSAFSWGADGCYLPLGSPELGAGTGGAQIAFAFPTGGSFIAQNFTGSVSGYTLAYTPNGVITINSKLVLTADNSKPLGVFWGVDAAGVGTITSVSAGTNISVTGSLSAPVVNVQNPLTATLNLGSQNMTAGDPATQTNSTTNNGGVSYNQAATLGGALLATYLANQTQISDPVLQENTFITPAQIILNNQSGGTQIQTNTITEIDIEIEDVNGTSGALDRATLTKQSLAYVNQDSGTPTLTNTSTYDNCSRTAVSLNVATGEQATRTEIVDKLLQSRQQQTLVQPSSSITSTINSNCEIIASVPQAYIQAITDNTTSLQTGAFGVSAQQGTAEMGVSFNNTNPGTEYQGQGNIITNGAGSSMTLTSANIPAASSHLLRFEVPLVGDALIEHQVVGAAPRNLDITTAGQFAVLAGASGGWKIETPPGGFSAQIQGTPSGQIIQAGSYSTFSSNRTGGVSQPSYTFDNPNATAGGYPAIKIDRSSGNFAAGDTISTISSWGRDGAGTSREWSRIQTKTENVTAANQDGTLSIYNSVNGALVETFNFNGGQNENNSFRPLDMNNNAVRTTTGDLTLNATASTGTGHIILQPKVAGEVQIAGAIAQLTNPAGQLNIAANTNMSISANNITETSTTSHTIATPSLVFTGAALQSASSSGNSGQHLVITLNGVQYKIALQNP